ncbi:MAG: CDP-alcohol phosphatidyltransferase family protein [Myxococcales bacterium]|nr:CDP-alcohol phosphatidyltransferase family protein [Myxococcales bacterium]
MSVLKYAVPNGFTALSMLFGLASVAMAAQGNFELAAWMILWGVLLDKLDGTAARLLNATSGFGVQFDSFADFVIFGIAPGFFFYFRLGNVEPFTDSTGQVALLGAIGFFVVASSARLARFNISEPPAADRFFYGVPTTFCGGLLALCYLTWSKYELSPSLLPGFVPLMVVAGLAMVSNLRLPKVKSRKNMALQLFQIGNILAAYVLGALRMMPEYLLGLSVLYISVGLVWGALYPPPELLEARRQTA